MDKGLEIFTRNLIFNVLADVNDDEMVVLCEEAGVSVEELKEWDRSLEYWMNDEEGL